MALAKLLLLYPVGALVANERTKVWLKLCGADMRVCRVEMRWQPREAAPHAATPVVADGFFEGVDLEFELLAPADPAEYVLELLAVEAGSSAQVVTSLRIPVQVRRSADSAFAPDPVPLSYAWGIDRGIPVHRLHLERFLAAHAKDIRGRCLEFQEARYVPRFAGAAVEQLDIVHIDDSNPNATIVADITAPNEIPDGAFDCIVCTHVLHSIFHLERAVAGLHRILAPGGVLLVAVPQISMSDRRFDELWRFTVAGLDRLLGTVFAPEEVAVSAFGNSFTSAGELRGMVASEFPDELLNSHDERFAAEVCARAQKCGR